MIVANKTYQPVVYSQEVRQLEQEAAALTAEIEALPQEKLQLSQQASQAKRSAQGWWRGAVGSAGAGIAGLFAARSTPVGYALAAAGAIGALVSIDQASRSEERSDQAERRLAYLPLHKMNLEDNRDFVAGWASDRRHTEWHEVNGYQ